MIKLLHTRRSAQAAAVAWSRGVSVAAAFAGTTYIQIYVIFTYVNVHKRYLPNFTKALCFTLTHIYIHSFLCICLLTSWVLFVCKLLATHTTLGSLAQTLWYIIFYLKAKKYKNKTNTTAKNKHNKSGNIKAK